MIPEQLFELLVSELRPGMRTVEFGAGLSTRAFDAAGCQHTAVEESAEWAERIGSPSIVQSDLTPDGWYAFQPAGRFHFVLIDGPAGQNRRGACQLPALMPGATVVIDDTMRAAEDALARRLETELPATRTRITAGDRSFDVLRCDSSGWQNPKAHETFRRVRWYQRMLPDLNVAGATLIDVGSGDGLQAAAFAEHFAEVHAIDAGSTTAAPGDRGPGNLHFHRATLPAPDDHPQLHCMSGIWYSADFLFCSNVLEHIDPATLRPFLEECRRLLKKGGGAFFSWAPVWSPIGQHVGNRCYTWEHIRRCPAGWADFLTEQFGTDFRMEWMRHEWRPGVTRRDWLQLGERHLRIADVLTALDAAGFEILHHNTNTGRTGEFLALPEAERLLESASLIDFTCESDTYLVTAR